MPEIPFVASDGAGDEVRFKGAEPYLEGRVLMTGFHGDRIWGKDAPDLSENIVRHPPPSGLALTEYRLWAGFIHCAVPFWGGRQIREVNAISHSPEMEPWGVPGPYSRPICRRIVEGAGVPRELFGMRKRASSTMLHIFENFLTPLSAEDFLIWIREHRGEWIKHGRIPPAPDLALDRWIYLRVDRCANILKHIPVFWRLVEKFEDKPTYLRRYTFPWAVEHAMKRYPPPL
jgi:hypothetical protein